MRSGGRWPIVVAILLLPACREAASQAPAQEDPPPPVRVQVVSSETRSRLVRAAAPVRAERRAKLAAEAAGHVVEAPFRRGAKVQEGDVILRVGAPGSAVSVSQARARVDQAHAALRQVSRGRQNAERLAEQNASTPNGVETARDQELEARARLAEAEAGLKAARARLSETVLRAPFAGVLADVRVTEGDYVRPGQDVAILVDPTSLEAELLLDPIGAADTRVGAPVAVTAGTADELTGRVALVGEVLDPASRRLPVRVSIADPRAVIRPGMIATFDVAVGEPRELIVVPEGAVLHRMGLTRVLVVDGEVANARNVRLGEIRQGRAEVLEGLDEGDRVVVEGIERVVPGRAVRVVDSSSTKARVVASDPSTGDEAP